MKIESPQNGALSGISAGSAFSAVTIAVSEPFLLPAAEDWSPGWGYVLHGFGTKIVV
jgi:hypothetical protein